MESAYLRIPRKKKRDPRDRRLGSRGSLLFYSKHRGTNQSVVFDLALVNVGVAVNQDTEDIILNDRRNGRHLLGRDDEFPHCARVAQ